MTARSPGRRRTFAVIALSTVALLAPVQSTIWNGDATPAWIAFVPWVDAALSAAGSAMPSLPAYDVFGRGVVVGYAALVTALLAWGRVRDFTGAARTAWHLGLGALFVATAADVVAYWLAGLSGAALRSSAFCFVEVPALSVAIAALTGAAALARCKAVVRRR